MNLRSLNTVEQCQEKCTQYSEHIFIQFNEMRVMGMGISIESNGLTKANSIQVESQIKGAWPL